MGDSKTNIGLIIITLAIFLVAVGLLVWVQNKTESMANGFGNIDPSQVHVCTDAEKQAQMCTMEYMPVCGNDGKTYGNKCSACAAKIDNWTQGEC